MSFAVATTKTGAVFSDSQVRNVPNTRAVVPPSLTPEPCVPANALSISSTQRMVGATDSATAMARRTLSSEEPTRLPNIRPMSNRSNGSCHRQETAFAHKLLPQPCTPNIKIPLGAGKPNARASSVNATARFCSQSFKTAIPPTFENVSLVA